MTNDDKSYEIVPLEKKNIENAAAVTGGILGFVIGGPVLGLFLAATSNYVSKQETDPGEALRGLGKTVIDSYNFIVKVNTKYSVADQVKDKVATVTSSIQTDSETLDTVKKTVNTATAKLEEINKEYDLVSKGKEAISTAADFSDSAIEKVIELNKKYDFVASIKKVVADLVVKIKDVQVEKKEV